MTGAVIACAGMGGARLMTVGAASWGTAIDYRGYVSAGSYIGALIPDIGTLDPDDFITVPILAVVWQSDAGGSSTGQVKIEFDGTQTAGFITGLWADGVSLGAVGAPISTPSTTTIFNIGSSTAANPFGTSGTVVIAVA